MSRRRPRRQKMGPGRTSGDPVDPVTIPDGATVFFHLMAGTPELSVQTRTLQQRLRSILE